MQKHLLAFTLAAGLFGTPAHAEFTNGGFENLYDGWTAIGDLYLITHNGSNPVRHSYLTYEGWEGADVWFTGSSQNAAQEGNTYLVVGSRGNESAGSLLTDAWTATNQYVSFAHAGNMTAPFPNKAFAQIRSLSGDVLAQIDITSYNDQFWRTWSLDLASVGLSYGDQFRFYYEDGYSWSVLDNVQQSGAQLQAPVSVSAAGAGLALLLAAGASTRRRR